MFSVDVTVGVFVGVDVGVLVGVGVAVEQFEQLVVAVTVSLPLIRDTSLY
jgi:hypothetical protein